jgi:glycosyltransferase involved in cell wall biosynthesis
VPEESVILKDGADMPGAPEDFLSIVIPAYNEAENIRFVVQEALDILRGLTSRFEIIVVDDASTDETGAILAELSGEIPQLKVIRNPQNIGCHPSSLVGYAAAQGDYCYFIPADRQIPAAEITKFLACAKAGHDVVYSWRQHREDPPHRLWISGFYNLLVRWLFGIRVHDVDSSELLTGRAVAQILPRLRSNSAFITVEILLEAQRQGLRIGEVIIDHRPRLAGKARGLSFPEVSRVPANFFRVLFWFWRQKVKGYPMQG